MKPKEILVFGATGQIGRHLIRKLTKNNYKVVAVTRNIHQKGYFLKMSANSGYLEIVELKKFDLEKIRSLMKTSSVCINLIGILFEKGHNSFKKIHTDVPNLLSLIAKEEKIDQFIHVSALGIDNAKDSKYAISKIEGENSVKENFKSSVILKPSIVYSVDDNFTTQFFRLLNLLPFMPLYYEGKTKFMPIHVSDMAEIIFKIIEKKITEQTIECVGPEILSFKEIILKMLNSIDKKRFLFPMPFLFAKISTKIFELMPTPIITTDQLKLLKYDNVITEKNKTNLEIGIRADRKFYDEIEKYSYNWKSGGLYSKNKNLAKK